MPDTQTEQESILRSIKKLLGVGDDYDAFDTDIVIAINSALSTLHQLGVGPETAFTVSNNSTTWSDFLGTATNLDAARSYVYITARLLFDPPQNAFLVRSLEALREEYTFRLLVAAEDNQNG